MAVRGGGAARKRKPRRAVVDGGRLSGWRVHERERCDLLHRVRVFPSDVARWRENLVDELLGGKWKVYGSAVLIDSTSGRAFVDEAVSRLREVARILALIYGQNGPGSASERDAWRVLVRLDTYRWSGAHLPMEGYARKTAALESLVPPNIAASLKRTMADQGL